MGGGTIMKKICLCLPTNRECASTIELLYRESLSAIDHFMVEIKLLVLDTSIGEAAIKNRNAVNEIRPTDKVEVIYLDESSQRAFLSRIAKKAQIPEDRFQSLMLPKSVSYGACTNRAFIIASALGCSSIHRRDSDCTYQSKNGAIVYPLYNELRAIGEKAADVCELMTETDLTTEQKELPISVVGASFIGEMSVDIGEIASINQQAYFDTVSLWAKPSLNPSEKRALVEKSFRGGGQSRFVEDETKLGAADPMFMDMCNIAFENVHEQFPLPPAKNTIGSDYFLMHLIHNSSLPGVVHNRHIDNFYTPERRTEQGFREYQFRFVKFLLSMPYYHECYRLMAEENSNLLDKNQAINVPCVLDILRSSLTISSEEGYRVIEQLISTYCALGSKYERFANQLNEKAELLIAQAREDMADFVFLAECWESAILAAKALQVNAKEEEELCL
ncbi:DUF6271 family protein [Vibrio cionasavignyae]|uniref:DUF6271 family protein n=1 Tax=Vibrio cionasavignyae TaxID=2910252 RepID=UPI003D13863E